MKTIEFLSSAWYGDLPLELDFPDHWELTLLGNQSLRPLSTEEIHKRILSPIATSPVGELAANRRRVAIILDDLSRPTPAADVVKILINELSKAGLRSDQILIFFATGTHSPVTEGEMRLKAGASLPDGIQWLSHNSQKSLKYIGKSARGTPLWMNQAVLDCDLRIGVGCLYPHPAAGFSGGAKSLVPGLAGFTTIRYLHDHMRGSNQRGGDVDNEFRIECEEIARQVGLDFIVNVALNQVRQITAVFAGDMVEAFRQGVDEVRRTHTVSVQSDADIVIVDMYPFDTEMQFAYDRGLWPLEFARDNSVRIVLADCPKGLGTHELFPLKSSFSTRLRRRITQFQIRDLTTLAYRLAAARRLVSRKKMDILLVSRGLSDEVIQPVFPSAKLFKSWSSVRDHLIQDAGDQPRSVLIYRSAPLMIPRVQSK
jgi:nickel-dependent lactate racemase